jgi:hypothetical protein
MRVLRVVRSESLDSLGEKLGGYEKSTLSTVMRHPAQAGKQLRRLLSRHYGAPFEVLTQPVDAEAIASTILKSYCSKGS